MSIKLENITYIYNENTSFSKKAIENINLEINQGEFIGLIGHTGSGKSTLISHLNALIKPTYGRVLFENQDIWDKNYNRKALRGKVGLVFQYPEHQLFETDVLKDVMFGPMNLGASENEAKEKAIEALKSVNFPLENIGNSPFELSGGQKKRVAIAGVLSMEPKVLVLDEPTAGLDPKGRKEVLSQLKELNEKKNMTIIIVSHNMEDMAEFVKRLIVMNRGTIAFDECPKEVFKHKKELESFGLSAPDISYIMSDLKTNGIDVNEDIITIEDAVDNILSAIQARRNLC